jgi:hypothetical protein
MCAKQHIAFLFGAGLSQSASLPDSERFPGTCDLTQAVLCGRWQNRRFLHEACNDSRCTSIFPLEPAQPVPCANEQDDPDVFQLRRFLDLLKQRASRHFFWKDITYEDIFFLAYSLNQHLRGRHDNPGLTAFADAIEHEFRLAGMPLRPYSPQMDREDRRQGEGHLAAAMGAAPTPGLSVADLSSKAYNYIKDVVSQVLVEASRDATLSSRETSPHWIVDAITHHAVDACFTLNHDTLLERLLKPHNGFEVDDGISPQETKEPWRWRPKFSIAEGTIPLLKLHGSVDWFRCNDRLVRRAKESSLTSADLKEGPLILTGTSNKEWDCSLFLYDRLQWEFVNFLSEVKLVVVCGYGFQDYLINQRFLSWLTCEAAHHVVIVDPAAHSLFSKALYPLNLLAAPDQWKRLEKQVSFLNRKAECTTWDEITGLLDRG